MRNTELDKAILGYLQQNGFVETVQSFNKELNKEMEPIVITEQMENVLQTRWNCVVKLQKRIHELEGQLSRRSEFFGNLFQSIGMQKSITFDFTKELLDKLRTEPSQLKEVTKLNNYFGPIIRYCLHSNSGTLLVHYSNCTSRLINLVELIHHPESLYFAGLVFSGHAAHITATCFSAQQSRSGNLLFATGSLDTTIRVYSVGPETTCKCIKTIFSHKGSITFLAFCSDNLLSYSKQEQVLRLHSVESGQELSCLREVPSFVCITSHSIPTNGGFLFIAITVDNAFYAIRITSSLLDFQQVAVENAQEFQHTNQITFCNWYSSNILATGSKDKSVKLWKVLLPTRLKCEISLTHCITLNGHSGWITNIHRVFDEILVAICEFQQQILLWHITENENGYNSTSIDLKLPIRNDNLKILFAFSWSQFIIVILENSSIQLFSIY